MGRLINFNEAKKKYQLKKNDFGMPIKMPYREGYDEDRKEGINAAINTYNVYLNRLEGDINYLREQLKNFS